MRNKLFRRFSLMVAITILFGASVVSGSNKKTDFPQRIAPLKTEKITIAKGLVLTKPQITDHLTADFSSEQGKLLEWIPVIETFSFKIETSSADLTVADVQIEIESCTGTKEIFKADSLRIRPGGEIRIEADYQVGREIEGPFKATLIARDKEGKSLFRGSYSFGYPRYHSSRDLKRVSCTATIRDDFNSSEINEELWRIWRGNPEQFRCEQKDGRYWIHINGRVGYNGLASKVEMDTRDVVLICRAGIETPADASHPGLVHLCGSGTWSPDHWFEIQLRDVGGRTARANLAATIPPQHRGGSLGPLALSYPASDGYLLKITSDASTNLCRGYVMLNGEWLQVGDAFEVPARKTRAEIKTGGGKRGESTTLWFDDFRMYPRSETHYVSVSLIRPDNHYPGTRNHIGWPPICFNSENNKVSLSDVSVCLYAADGKTLVDKTDVGMAFGYGLLKLKKAPWDIYPVGAVIRIFFKDQQIGPDHIIHSEAVDGLYPDDVYTIILE